VRGQGRGADGEPFTRSARAAGRNCPAVEVGRSARRAPVPETETGRSITGDGIVDLITYGSGRSFLGSQALPYRAFVADGSTDCSHNAV
jgi:hypothetical protein